MGEGLRGSLFPDRGDWLLAHPSGWGVLDVRVQIETNDGAPIYAYCPGLVKMNATIIGALASGAATRFESQCFRTTPHLETGDSRYAWVNRSVFVGRDARLKVSGWSTACPASPEWVVQRHRPPGGRKAAHPASPAAPDLL